MSHMDIFLEFYQFLGDDLDAEHLGRLHDLPEVVDGLAVIVRGTAIDEGQKVYFYVLNEFFTQAWNALHQTPTETI